MPSRPDRILLASDKTYRWPGESSSPRLAASKISSGASAAALSIVKATRDGSESQSETVSCASEHDLEGSNLESGSPRSGTIKRETDSAGAMMGATDDAVTAGSACQSDQKRTKKTPGGTGSGQNRVQKKHASSGRRQFFEFSRLGAVREGVDGRIEFKICWKPTWGTLEDLQGFKALAEARVLTINEYSQARWDDEIESSGHVD